MDTKPGIKTSEFWLMALAVVSNAVLSSGLIADMPEAVRITTIIVTVLGALGYTAARAWTKGGGK
jgi:hypothetical protein